ARCWRPTFVQLPTRPSRAAHAESPDADRRPIHGGDARYRGACPIDPVASNSNDRPSRPIRSGELDEFEVGLRGPGFDEEILGGVPALALEVSSSERRVGPRFDGVSEISTVRVVVFRVVYSR